jgi:hypothetical protein
MLGNGSIKRILRATNTLGTLRECDHTRAELQCNNCGALGRAIAQAVSRWLPTAAARVRAQVRSCGICGEQSGTGTGFL